MRKNIIIAVLVLLTGFASQAQVNRKEPPKPQPNPEINITIPDIITTENGMKLIVVENHKLPVVSFQLYVDYPTMPEKEKAGMTDLFGQLLGSGTSSYPKDDFDAKVDYMGAEIFTTARGFYASSLKKHTPKLLELLSEVVMKPAFPESEFDRIINQTKSGLATQKSDPNTMASNVASIVNYGKNHPYGEIVTESTLDNITLEDIKSHYNTYFVPNKAYLVVVGDVTIDEAKGYAEKYFADWKKGGEMKQSAFETPTYSGNNVYFVDKPGAVQSQISITHTVKLPPGHPDAIKVSLMNQILGGGSFSAHLMQNLREDKAYTYGCYSSITPDKLISSFTAGGSFRNEVTDSAIVQILSEIDWMTKNKVSESELTLVKNSMTGSFARSLEKGQTLANFALNTARYNLPKDYYTKYLTTLEAITADDILETAKKYLKPENMSIVVVGNSEIAQKLEVFDNNGGMEVRDAFGNEATLSSLKQVPEGVTAETVVQNYIFKTFMVNSQKEFDDKLAGIGMITKSYTGALTIQGMNLDMQMTTYAGKPNKTASKAVITTPQGAMQQKEYFNGEAGATVQPFVGKKKYEGDELEAKKEGTFPMEQCSYFTSKFIHVELKGIDEVDGKEYYKLKVMKEGSDDYSFEYYSVETGLLEMEESFTLVDLQDGNGEQLMTSMNYFSDFKEVKGGLFLAHSSKLDSEMQKMTLTLTKVEVKKKAKSGAFDGDF